MSHTKRRACSKSLKSVWVMRLRAFHATQTNKSTEEAWLINRRTYLLLLAVLRATTGTTSVPQAVKINKTPSVARKTAGFSGSSKTKR